MREGVYKNIGLQLRNVRERLRLTLDDLHKEVGISRSYISNFERGHKIPTAKYLKYLHDKYNVSLHYIFCSSGRMFRHTGEELGALDFGKNQEDVDELLSMMYRVPHTLHSMLVHFAEYKLENEEYIARFLTRQEEKQKEETEKATK
jgi:transcriptional regulator with XRE-family HTH domain